MPAMFTSEIDKLPKPQKDADVELTRISKLMFLLADQGIPVCIQLYGDMSGSVRVGEDTRNFNSLEVARHELATRAG